MKKYIVIVVLMLIIVPLKAMDPLTSKVEELYKNLEINLKDLTGKTKDERWNMVIKAYRKLALKYHPDRPGGGNVAEFHKIQEAREELGKLLGQSARETESIGQILEQFMEEQRKDSMALMTEAEAKKNQPSEAHDIYIKVITPFIGAIKIFGEDTSEYGLDIIGLAYLKTIEFYYQQSMYEHALRYGNDFIVTLQSIINNIKGKIATAAEGISYLKKYNLPGYDAEHNYKVLLDNFDKLKKTVGLAFDELRKKFIAKWQDWKKSFNSDNITIIKNILWFVKSNLKYEYTINGTSKVMLDPTEKNEYIKGYLKLADAYLKEDNKAEAKKTLEKGLQINNTLYAEKKISTDFKNEFERRLNTIKPKEAVSQDKNLINALIRLNNSLRMLYKKLPTSQQSELVKYDPTNK